MPPAPPGESSSSTSPAGKTLYSLNADKLFTPASNAKLFTTAAALALIGPDYRFRTTMESAGNVDHYGRLSGDLVMVGRGDPNLSGRTLPYYLRTERVMPPVRVLEDLADQLVARGVKVIDGDVVADDSYFVFERYGEGWSQDDLLWEWGAPVSALTVNDNVLFVSVLPAERIGERAYVNITPFADYYRIENRVMTVPAGAERRILINREPGSNRLTIWGSIPLGDPGSDRGAGHRRPGGVRRQADARTVGEARHRRLRNAPAPTCGAFQLVHLPRHRDGLFRRRQ